MPLRNVLASRFFHLSPHRRAASSGVKAARGRRNDQSSLAIEPFLTLSIAPLAFGLDLNSDASADELRSNWLEVTRRRVIDEPCQPLVV